MAQLFTKEPPPFVSFEKDSQAAYTFKGESYNEFIRSLLDECEKITDKPIEMNPTDEDEKKKVLEAAEKIAKPVIKFFTDNEHVRAKFAERVSFTRRDKNGTKSYSLSLDSALQQMLNQFLATLFSILTSVSIPKSLKWTHSKIIPPKINLEDVKYRVDTVTEDDLCAILKMKESLKEAQRIDARVTLTTKLNLIKTEDVKDLADEKQKIYNDEVIPVLMKFIEKFFLNTLAKSDRDGISAVKQKITELVPTSKITTILNHLYDKATLFVPSYDPDQAAEQADASDDDSDVEFVEMKHIPRQLEPPQMSCMSQQGWKLAQNIPLYLESEGDFIDFVEGKLANFQRKHNILTYADRAISIWSVFREPTQQNKFLQKFGAFLNPASLKDQNDYIRLYIGVMKLFYPHQKKSSYDYQQQLKTPSWYKQKEGESIDDLYTRLLEQFERAFPGIGIQSSQNKKQMAEILYDAFKDNHYRQYICSFHYRDFFELCKLNYVVIELRKREKIQMEMRLRKARNNALQEPATSVRNVTNKPVEKKPQNNSSTPNKKVSYVNNQGQSNKNNGFDNQKSNRNNNQNNSGFGNWKDVGGKTPKTVKIMNSKQFKEELAKLLKNQNLHPKGHYRVPFDQIPENIRSRPAFDINNYMPKDQYLRAKEQAVKNIEQRRAEAARQASSTKKNKRKNENHWRKTRVVVGPKRDEYQGRNISCNMAISNIKPTIDTYMLNCTFGEDDDKVTFPALWDTDAMM